MDKVIKIVIADDHPIFRDGVRRFLEMEAGFGVVGVASDGEEALDLVRSLHPDVLVFDMNMPRRNGVAQPATTPRVVSASAPSLSPAHRSVYPQPGRRSTSERCARSGRDRSGNTMPRRCTAADPRRSA